MAKRLSKRTERRILLNLAKHSLSLHDTDVNDAKRPRLLTEHSSTSHHDYRFDLEQTCVSPDYAAEVNSDSDDDFDNTSAASSEGQLERSNNEQDSSGLSLTDVCNSQSSSDASELDGTFVLDLGNESDVSSVDSFSSESAQSSSSENDAFLLVAPSAFRKSNERSPVPLYAGATVTAHQFDVAVASMALRHNLSYACQTDLLRLMATILPGPNCVPSRSHALTRKFICYEQQSLIHWCCGSCMCLLPDGEKCRTPHCVDQSIPDALFVEVHWISSCKKGSKVCLDIVCKEYC